MFGAPLFLIASAVGAMIPLILHLLQKRKTVQQPFPTLRFLNIAIEQSSRRIRLENLLLWLLRTLIMILLGLAFATPMLRTRGLGLFGRAPRDIAIVLDASYSMLYQAGRQTVWDRALEAAVEIINELDSTDRVSIFLARENAVPLIAEPVGDHERALAQLEDLKPGYDTSCLATAISAAYAALEHASQRRELELHVLTDNQALAWDNFGSRPAGDGADSARAGRRDSISFDDRAALFVGLFGVLSPANIAPLDIELSPPIMSSGTSARLAVRIERSGETAETTATLYINDKEIGRRALLFDAQSEAAASFVIPPMPTGTHMARIETPNDNLSIDNVFHFLLRVRDQLPVLCVGQERDTAFLRAALRAGAGGAEPRTVTPEQLLEETNLAAYSCIFLANVLPLPGQVIAELERYVFDGGSIAMFPGASGSLEDYRAWDCLPGMPSEITSLPTSERSRTLVWEQPDHVLIQALRDSLGIPRLDIQRNLSWKEPHHQATVLISAGPERPFLLQRDYGSGSVLMFSITADRAWSNFPLSPFYLPTIMQIIEYSGGVGTPPPFVWCGDAVEIDGVYDAIDSDMTLLDPDGQPVQLRATAHSGPSRGYTADLSLPGIYSREAPGEPNEPMLAANFLRDESDLTTIDPDRISSLIGANNLFVATDREALQRAIREYRIGRTYGEQLLLLALILIVVEFCYANMLSQKKTELSAQLGLTESGKIRGHGVKKTDLPRGAEA